MSRTCSLCHTFLAVLVAALLPHAALAGPLPASAPPPLPASFYGEIQALPAQFEAGSGQVQVFLPEMSEPIVTAPFLPVGAPGGYRLDVPGDITGTPEREGAVDGEPLTFKIAGSVMAVASWRSGTNTHLAFHAPRAVVSAGYSADQGVPLAFDLPVEDAGGDVVEVAWDWEGDGRFDPAGPHAAHTWSTPGVRSVPLRLTDAGGARVTYDLVVAIRDLPPAAVSIGGPYTAPAGQNITLAAQAVCPVLDACLYAWDLDANGILGEAGEIGPSVAFARAEPGIYPVCVRVTDREANAISACGQVQVSAAVHSLLLRPGWNLVSAGSTSPGQAPADLLASITGCYDLVYAWDAAHQQWLKYAPASPIYANTLPALDALQGFWVHMTAEADLQIPAGAPSTLAAQLYPGWNLAGYPLADERPLPAALQDHGVDTDFSLVYAYNLADPAQPWKLFDRAASARFPQELTALSAGWGYWVQVGTEHTWTLP